MIAGPVVGIGYRGRLRFKKILVQGSLSAGALTPSLPPYNAFLVLFVR
jgi:hypothetical protein